MWIARLPMYDWPEIRPATDALWAAWRDLLRAQGVPAPDALSRSGAGQVLVGQTCGLPFVRGVNGAARLIGRPEYGVAGWTGGRYRSAIIARVGSGLDCADTRGARFAVNGLDSLSGYVAAMDMFGAKALSSPLITGAHRESVRAVAAGRADVAAIDALCWALAQRHEPAARAVEVIGWTRDRPAMPFYAGPKVAPAIAERAAVALKRLAGVLSAEVLTEIPLIRIHPADAADFDEIRALDAARP